MNTQLIVDLPKCGTPYSLWNWPNIQHSNHHGPAPSPNTLLILDLPYRNTPTAIGPLPLQNTLLIWDLPHWGTPYSLWTCLTAVHPTHLEHLPPQNTLLTLDLPHRGMTYSTWTCPTTEQPTHRWPAPRGTPYSLNGRRPIKRLKWKGTSDIRQILRLKKSS